MQNSIAEEINKRIAQQIDKIKGSDALNSITTPINVGERCVLDFAQKKNIFDNKNYIINLTDKELENLNNFKHNLDNVDGSYSICKVDKDVAYENCALAMNNPYLSMNTINNKQVCSLSCNTLLPDNTRYKIEFNSSNTILLPDTEIYFRNSKKSFCQERWNDWFCIPNYHLNNRWYNDLPDDLLASKSVGNCLMPCDIGYVPSETDPMKCILKSEYLGGIYAHDFDYTPIALICLLGTSFETFTDEKTGYVSFIKEIKKQIDAENGVELLKKDNKDVITSILESSILTEHNPIWTAVKDDITQNVQKLFLNIKTDEDFLKNNIIQPTENVKTLLKVYLTKDKILYAYNIAKTIKEKLEDIDKYKDWRFKLHRITNIANDKFKFLLRMLKRSCNVCFDGKTPFSSDMMLFTLNKEAVSTGDEYTPIILDEVYDPEDVEFIIYDFKSTQKIQVGMFDDYKQYFKLYELSLYTYLQFIIIIVALFVIYMLYIVFYAPINRFINSIITFFIYKYFDIEYYLTAMFSKYTVDNREEKRLKLIQYYLETFKDFDKKYLL